MNFVSLTGNLGRDIELKYTSGGKPIAKGSIAVSFGRGEEKKTDWFNLVFWSDLAVQAEKYLKKGSRTTITGRLANNNYKKQDGTEVKNVEVVVNSFGIPEPKKEEQTERAAPQVSDEDIPF